MTEPRTRASPGRRRPAAVPAAVVVLVLVGTVLGGQVARVAWGPAPDAGTRRAQLTHLRDALDDGAAERMQDLFPEGYAFTEALTGLAAALPAAPGDHVALDDARRALAALRSPAGTAPFAAEQQPRFGAFHTGWSLLLAVEVARLSGSGADAALARSLATEVAGALTRSPTGLLTSYPGQVWPVDTVVAVAGLARADRAVGVPGAPAAVQAWVRRAATFLDPATGLLPHRTTVDGQTLQGPRGSSQALVQLFWPDVDAESAPRSWARFRRAFVVRRAGLVGVREFPVGTRGRADVDSGPLLLGVSPSATVVALGAARRAGDLRLATGLDREAELLGLPLQWRGARSYALGLLPVGDAFLAHARAQPATRAGGASPASASPQPAWPMLLTSAAVPLWSTAVTLAVRRFARRRRRQD